MVQILQPVATAAQAAGAVLEAEVAAWLALVVRDGQDGIGFWAVTYVVVVGTKA
jgi:hypothetical protein